MTRIVVDYRRDERVGIRRTEQYRNCLAPRRQVPSCSAAPGWSRVGKLALGFVVGAVIGRSAPAGSFNEPGIAADSPALVAWADGVASFVPAPEVPDGQDTANVLGPYNTSLVSLGELNADQIASGAEPGQITLMFSSGIGNGPGGDLAVFENGFTFSGGLFAELAYVEVSSDGTNFARFPNISTNDGPLAGTPPFAAYDMTNVYNLAGKHPGGQGTLFDLDDLTDDPLVASGMLDLDRISHVRLVDIPGSGDWLDSQGHPIVDNWPTTGTGGFDLRAVGVVHVAVPEPGSMALAFVAALAVAAWMAARLGWDRAAEMHSQELQPASKPLDPEIFD